MNWDKLRHENCTSKIYHSDCQVVSAVNAYYVLTGKVAFKNEAEYRRLCHLAKACHGSAISIEKIYKKLGMERYKTTFFPYGSGSARFTGPIECTVWHAKYGYHSVLIIDRSPKCEAVRITNFMVETTTDGWMFEENLNHFLDSPKGWKRRMERCWKIRLTR